MFSLFVFVGHLEAISSSPVLRNYRTISAGPYVFLFKHNEDMVLTNMSQRR